MNIYQKIKEEIAGKKGVDVFVLEEKLGMEDVKRVINEKRKMGQNVLELPVYEVYFLVSCKNALEQLVATEFSINVAIETPPEGVMADFAIPCFLLRPASSASWRIRRGEQAQGGETATLRQAQDSPQERAKRVASAITEAGFPFVDFAVAQGPYVNVRVHSNQLAQETLSAVENLGEHYGATNSGGGKTIIIEYSSPNSAKPMSVGHLRSTIIGESLKRLYEFQGYSVIGINHFGDFGTQFGKLLYAMSQWKDAEALKNDPIKEMLRLYVKFHEEAKEDAGLEEKAREIFKKLEQGDAELVSQWAEVCAISTEEFQKTYQNLGVQIDLLLGESFYQSKLAEIVDRCIAKKIAVKNEDGSVAVNFENEIMPSFLLAKKDGSSLYATRDIAAAEFRLKEFTPEKIIYVVGNEQTLHFRQVFAVLGLLGNDVTKFKHDGFGMISLPEGKMSTREGRVIFLDALIAEAIERAENIVKEKNPEVSDAQKKETASAVGVGAIIYNDLSQSRERDIEFRWDRALSMEGNSAPYLQYGYARAMSILKKAGASAEFKKEHIIIETSQEQKLVRMLARFPIAVKNAQEADAPHVVATYLNNLVQEFARFYNECPVLSAEGNVCQTRLYLVKATAQVIKNGLTLLGVKTLERM